MVTDSLQSLKDIVYNQLYPYGYPLIPTLSANNSNVITSKGDSTAYYAFDNNGDTYCDKMYNNEYVGYDFSEILEINTVKITVNSWSGSPMSTGFILQSSEDNVTWDNVYVYLKSIIKDTVEISDLNVKARYIRVLSTFTGNTSYGLSVNTLQCYKKLS